MTACVNRKHTKKVAAVVTASLVGALSLGAAPVAAMADTGIETLATDLENWQNGEFEFSSSLGNNGAFNLKEGDTLSFVGATDAAGNEYGASDVTVLFFSNNSSSIQPGNTLVDEDDAIAGRAGTMPKVAGAYWVVVFQGDILDNGELFDYQDGTTLSELTAINGNYKAYKLNVTAKTTALADVEAFQYDAAATDKGMADTEFNYTGAGINIGFKAGDKLLEDADYDVVWISTPGAQPTQTNDYFTATAAGTYTVRLKGTGSDYTGTVDVTFEIKGIDLSSADIAVSPVETGSLTLTGGNVLDNKYLTVNGVALDNAADMVCTLIAMNDTATSSIPGALTTGKYTFRVSDKSNSSDVKGSAVIDLYVVDNEVEYTYNSTTVSTLPIATFNPAMGSTFTPDAFSATANGKKVPFTVKVTKDGQEVTSYTEPGTYKVVLDTPRSENADGTYAGHVETSFKVWGVNYSGSTVYVSIDGKNVDDNGHIDYTGAEYSPVVVARDADNEQLEEGVDYTWKLVDSDGNEVQSASKTGSYKVIVTFADGTTEEEIAFSIDKAEILSAKAAADFFAIPADGSAAVPSFIGSTNKDYDKGVKFDLDANQVSIAYYNAQKLPNGDLDLDTNGNPQIDLASRVDAEDLTEAGTYFAMINVLSTTENIEGSGIEVPFVLADSVVFTDVDANAWYADPVYKAAELKYMNGISGTRLFMPEANITRAEIACVMFNMAGGQPDADKNYPTGFEDVAADTWYSQAVAWASQNGVINGYDTGLYGTFDNATREQVAAILYNYADAQGMDVSVDDVDATLAKFDDGAQVSDWAKEAVAWAVENGVMGNGGFLNPTGTITRAEVAAMAVNFQPEAL